MTPTPRSVPPSAWPPSSTSYVTTARRWLADGTLPTVVGPDESGVPRRWVRISDVWGYRDRLAGRLLLPDVAESLGLRYPEAYLLLRRLDLDLEQHPTTGEYELTPEGVGAMRAEAEPIWALYGRSMKLAAAARQPAHGGQHRRLDGQEGRVGGRTRDRLQAALGSSPDLPSRPPGWPAKSVASQNSASCGGSVAELARFAGHTSAELADLVKAAVLEQLSGRRQLLLTAASLRAWISMAEGEPGHSGLGRLAGGTAS